MPEYVEYLGMQWWRAYLFFLACITIGNLITYFFPPSERRLKQLDYIWLTLAGLGVFTVLADQQRTIVGNYGTTPETRLHGALLQYPDKVIWTRGYACDVRWGIADTTPPEGVAKYKATKDACTWFTALAKTVVSGGGDLRKLVTEAKLDPPDNVKSAWHAEVEDTSTALTNARKAIVEFDNVKAAAEKSGIDMVLSFFAPYLLSIGLGVRFAKVTGELRRQTLRSREELITAATAGDRTQ